MKITAMSDLHLSKKPWQVRRAFAMARDADLVLLAGDLVNDGTPEQLELMQRCVSEVLPDTPVLAVAGNHDYPRWPSPMIREGICDYPALQDWLLKRQPYPYILDDSGAYAVRAGEIEVIGLNCAWHWRRFKFVDGAQLKWLEDHLDSSGPGWHIVLCHAPLLAHNPKRSDTKPYLSRDGQLQRIVDTHRNIIFISGHTHISMENGGCVEHDAERNNIYINAGSIRPTTVLKEDGTPEPESGDGNIVELYTGENMAIVSALSVKTGRQIFRWHKKERMTVEFLRQGMPS